MVTSYIADVANDADLLLQSFAAPAGIVATFPAAIECGKVFVPSISGTALVDFLYDGSVLKHHLRSSNTWIPMGQTGGLRCLAL